MLFQGEEFGANSPFYYFADHNPELARLVSKGRREFLGQFPSVACPECESILPDPEVEQTFLRSKLDLTEREKHQEIYRLHRDLIRLRRSDPTFANPRPRGIEGAVLAPEALVIRFWNEDDPADPNRVGRQRLVIVNLGIDLTLRPAPEPLLAPPENCQWKLIWSSEDPCYGGSGTPPLEEESWRIPGHATLVMSPESDPLSDATVDPKN